MKQMFPTISFGQVMSEGHDTIPSTAKPVALGEGRLGDKWNFQR